MIAAMLLSLAGVEREEIVDDYEAAFRGVNAFLVAHPETSREPARTAEELDARVAERRVALADWLASLDVAGYLADAGVADEVIDRLRTRLVI